MISPNYYTEANTQKTYLGGKVRHYMLKNRAVVLKKYPYVIKEGETIYSIAYKVFDSFGIHNWTIITDINQLRPISEWKAGDLIYLPEIILKDPEIRTIDYEQTSAKSTPIQY